MGRAEKSVTETKRLTDRVLRTIKDSYNRIAFQKVPPYVMESENLRDILDEFLPILAKKKPFDKEGTTNLVMYAAPRLPQEIFNLENDIVVKFNDDPNFFVEAGIKKEGVKSPPSRNRWYKVETVVDEKRQDANKTIITIHAQSQTAVIETLVHLSAVEILRERIRTILGPNKQIDQDEINFLWETLNLLVNNHGDRKQGNLLGMWINRKITVEGMANMATWDELMSKEKPSKTALALAEEAHRFLDGKNRPSVILFSNSYSLSNILSQYLLNKNIGGLTVRQYIKEKAVEAWDMHDKRSKTKTSLESLGESIRSIKAGLDQNQLNFIIDNMIVFDLTRNKNGIFNDEIIDGFVDKFKDPQRLSDLGIETVLRADQSPTTEPLYYIDFTSIKDEVIDNLNPLLKGSIAKLREKKLSAFYLPYLPGDLTYSTIIEMKKMIDSITAVAEVGKVAHLIVDKQQRDVREIGQFVIPTQTFSSYGESKLESLSNQVKKAHGRLFEQFRVVSETSLMQVLSVILQDKLEILDIVKSIFPNTYIKENITINMEVGPIRQAVNKLRLLLFEADYISDHAISSEMFEEYKALGKEKLFQQITKSLDRKGRYGVAAATAAVLTAIADSKKI